MKTVGKQRRFVEVVEREEGQQPGGPPRVTALLQTVQQEWTQRCLSNCQVCTSGCYKKCVFFSSLSTATQPIQELLQRSSKFLQVHNELQIKVHTYLSFGIMIRMALTMVSENILAMDDSINKNKDLFINLLKGKIKKNDLI